MRRTLYVIAAVAVIAGLLGVVPLVARRAATARTGGPHANVAAAGAPPPAAGSTPASSGMKPAAARPVRIARARTLGAVGGTLPGRLVRPRLVVEKTGRTLTVYSADRAVKVYRVALGRVPEGDKQREGDGRTPLGTFYICNKNPQSSFHKSLGLSYPNGEDARRGRGSGLVSSSQERAILEAIEHRRQPPWDTKLGGMIMVHGGGTATDWTTGCVAMSNADIDELFPLVPTGTAVLIEERPPPSNAASAETLR